MTGKGDAMADGPTELKQVDFKDNSASKAHRCRRVWLIYLKLVSKSNRVQKNVISVQLPQLGKKKKLVQTIALAVDYGEANV